MVMLRAQRNSGFSLVEVMIAMAVSVAVLGGAAAITARVQTTFQYQLHDVAVEQEARHALDWISRDLTPAGTNPYSRITLQTTTSCPAVGTPIQPLWLDPNGNGVNDDVRIQADVGSRLNAPGGVAQPRFPNGLILGPGPGLCDEPNEDVTVAHDAGALVITRFDRAVDIVTGPVIRSDGIFTSLRFTYLDANMAVTAIPANVRTVRVVLQGRSRGRNPHTGQFTTFTLQRDVRLRTQ